MQYQGLSPAEVEESWKKYGANVLEPPPKESAWRLFLGKFRDPVILVLILAASVSILTGGLVESAGILLAILLSTNGRTFPPPNSLPLPERSASVPPSTAREAGRSRR